jgi:hypothetical protein
VTQVRLRRRATGRYVVRTTPVHFRGDKQGEVVKSTECVGNDQDKSPSVIRRPKTMDSGSTTYIHVCGGAGQAMFRLPKETRCPVCGFLFTDAIASKPEADAERAVGNED